jgi:hypothetical protein
MPEVARLCSKDQAHPEELELEGFDEIYFVKK